MCGIAGILAVDGRAGPPARDELARMARALAHRGPDESGVTIRGRAGLAHARLSIIDLATGQQPLSNEDDTVWVTFNGEIFNYVELREQLLARGHRFKTRSDTEVVVHAYEEWGVDALARFNGQFAIGLWDTEREQLVLARDPLGVRPIFVCEHANRLFFASEVKAIFAADPTIPRAFDPEGLAETFTFWSVVPPQSVFAGVREIEPGSVHVFRASGERTCRPPAIPTFPTEPSGGFRGSIDDAVNAVRNELEEATRLRMLRADVPVGSYLSGGIDSSLVAALGQRAKGERITTFSLRFEDAEYDETPYQRLAAEHIGSIHREIVVSSRDIANVFPDVIAHTERPILRTAPAPLFLLSKLVRDEGIKVVLTGEGADEMFAGYDLFREAKVRRFWAKQPESEMRPRLLERLYPYLARSPVAQAAMAREFFGMGLAEHAKPGFGHALRWRTTSALRRLFSADMRAALAGHDAVARFVSSLPAEHDGWTPLARDQYVELKTLLAGYILSSQGDRMLMAHSVEGRFPFLDANVAALAYSLPDAYKLRVLDEKHVVKRVARGLVPDAIIDRKKQPYRAPDALAFSVATAGAGAHAPDWIGDVLSDRAIKSAGVFDPAAVARLRAKVFRKDGRAQFSNADNMAIVGVLSTQLLHRRFVEDA
jgi:asparagine synthase (glutamine-hydrolysing)